LGPGDSYEGPAPADTNFNPADFESPPASAPDVGPDPFDPVSLRLTQDFTASIGVKKALLTVPVRTPDKSWFVRVHPEMAYRVQTAVVELREEREIYLIVPKLRPDLATEPTLKPKLLATGINRQGVVFLWAVNLPRSDGRVDHWSRSALEAVERAVRSWVRISPNMSLGAYDVFEANSQLSDPEWPEISFHELLRVAFKDRLIDSLDHPVLRRLRGEL
jgi:hypothetical protein